MAKKTSSCVVLALHVTRIVDALGAPYDMKLARCFRFPLVCRGAIQDAGLGHVEVMRWGNPAQTRSGKGDGKGGKGQEEGQGDDSWSYWRNDDWSGWQWETPADTTWETWAATAGWAPQQDGDGQGQDGSGQGP